MEGVWEELEEDRMDMVFEISTGRGGSSDDFFGLEEGRTILPLSFPFLPFFFFFSFGAASLTEGGFVVSMSISPEADCEPIISLIIEEPKDAEPAFSPFGMESPLCTEFELFLKSICYKTMNIINVLKS